MIKRLILCLLFCLFIAAQVGAADYIFYFSDDAQGAMGIGSDSNDCLSTSTPCRSMSKIESMINGITNGTDSVTVNCDGGDIWTMTGNSDSISINRSNVTIQAYGTGKPTFSGDQQYPDNTGGFIFQVGDNSGVTVTNVNFLNLIIRDTHDQVSVTQGGGGIIFAGTENSDYFTGPGLIQGCEFYDFGWSAISIYRVPNVLGPDYAVRIENNYIHGTGWWSYLGSTTGPQSINANDGYSSGHIARHNVITESQNEGIGAQGMSLVEYNDISGTRNPGIYVSCGNRDMLSHTITIRYNHVWRKAGDGMTISSAIRLDDEGASGDNSGLDLYIYGNIIAGDFYAGIDLRNAPDTSNWGPVRVWGNTIIDTDRNFILQRPQRFNSLSIKNNLSVINDDAASSCEHVVIWNSTGNPVVSNIGPNVWAGDGYTSETDLPSDWRDGTNLFDDTDEASLEKQSGWRSITTTQSLASVTPAADSIAIDRSETDDTIGSSYDDLIRSGSGEYSDLPDSLTLSTVAQGDHGTDWEFGAIIYYDPAGAPPTTYIPMGRMVPGLGRVVNGNMQIK